MIYDDEYLEDIILEGEPYHTEWVEKAQRDKKFARGDQWDEDVKKELQEQGRPALTLNLIRPLIRLLTGMERKSRYDMRAMPVGDSDSGTARIITGLEKQIEYDNNAQMLYSEMYKHGLESGRGWLQVDVSYDWCMYGDIVYREIDPFEIAVDPYARRYDLRDARYLYRHHYMTEDTVTELYPSINVEELSWSSTAGIYAFADMPRYELYEVWYRKWAIRTLLADMATGDIVILSEEDKQKYAKRLQENARYKLVDYKVPRMHWAVLDGSLSVVEKGESPFTHNFFPYVNFYAEFLPRFHDLKPDWLGIVRDLIDPSEEKNKRRSQYSDIINRIINTGHRFTEGAVVNQDELGKNRRPDHKIIMAEDKFGEYEPIRSDAPNPALFQLDQINNQDLQQISSIPPDLAGFEQSSRESGRAVMLRQNAGSSTLAPYQDNMRLARKTVAQITMALIQQLYTTPRMVKMIDESGDTQQVEVNVPPQEAFERVKNDLTLGKYDIQMAEIPSTPTMRQGEFVELMEMVKLGVLPITPGVAKFIVESSDMSLKGKLLGILDGEFKQQQEQQKEAQQQELIAKHA